MFLSKNADKKDTIKKIRPNKKNITITHLLTHSSGLKPFVEYYKTENH